jgi:hypothetical protein
VFEASGYEPSRCPEGIYETASSDQARDADRRRCDRSPHLYQTPVGGFLGLGDKWVPVPWDAVALQPNEKVLILKIEKDKLQKAPNFDRTTLPELANRQWGAVIHTYYGYPPCWEKGQ